MSTPPPIIRVFLSANIPDMRAEREYLHKRLFPRIVAWYEKRGIGVELIDPARTRTEREAEDPAALKMGFAAVRECKPFFVGLIGQRYGRELNESTREAACFPRLRRVPFNSSRIHLEAILGVLDEPEQAVGGFIYVRTSDYLKQLPNALLSLFTGDHVNEVRLKYLLVELRECGRPVREYHCTWDSQGNQIAGLDTLGRLIANDFELAIHVHLYGPRSTFIPSLARELFTPRQENTPLRMSQSPRKDVAVDLGSLKPPTKDDTGLRAEEVDLGGPLVPSEHDTGVGLPSAQLPLPDSPPYVDENVQFTVYRPKVIQPAQWYQLLAFAHLSERRPDAAPDEPDPLKQVASIVQQRLGTKVKEYEGLKQDASQGVPRGDEITFVPRVTGIDFNPKRRTFHWLKSVHVEEFDMMARPEMDGKTVRGKLTVFLGPIILADVNLVIAVDSRAQTAKANEPPIANSVEPYRKIFASYSHKDLMIVEHLEKFAKVTGDEYLRDWKHLRAGELWDNRLMGLIGAADIFQLFWSRNSMLSEFVRREWQHALSLGRPNFVRPTYWEEPMPMSKDPQLPPPELANLHFEQISASLLPRSPASIHAPGSLYSAPPAVPVSAPLPPAPARKERPAADEQEAAVPDSGEYHRYEIRPEAESVDMPIDSGSGHWRSAPEGPVCSRRRPSLMPKMLLFVSIMLLLAGGALYFAAPEMVQKWLNALMGK